MNLDEATQNFEENYNNQANEDSANTEHPQSDNNENESLEAKENTQDIVDLDSLEKFKWDGKEYTRDELGKMAMRQSDYTRKTQELAEEKKYVENFTADFRTLQANNFAPELVEKFKEIYPEKFHKTIDQFLDNDGTSREGKEQNLEDQIKKYMEPHLKDLESIKQEAYEKKVDSEMKWLDNQFETLSKKYPYASDELVNSKLVAMYEQSKQSGQNLEVTENLLEKMFKQENEAYRKKIEAIRASEAKEQSQVNAEAFDTGRGGSPAVQQGKRKPMTLEDAEENAINNLTR
jgi:hypothetical protein